MSKGWKSFSSLRKEFWGEETRRKEVERISVDAVNLGIESHTFVASRERLAL
jgi:hypothetical protein